MNLRGTDLLEVGHERVMNADTLRRSTFNGVSTDSRHVRKGELFFALRGDRFDGHAFISDVIARGAACVVIDHVPLSLASTTPALVVKDTSAALGRLAGIYRRKFSIPVVAIAGSNGKTTTKDMTADVLATQYRVLKTMGNLNNHIGVPQTIFRLERKHELAVVEIGTNHFGELAYLCDILAPTHGLITNIGLEHLEFFKNIHGVARGEGELFEYLSAEGVGFVNADDTHVVRLSKRLSKKRTYGFGRRADVRGSNPALTARGHSSFRVSARDKKDFTVRLSVPGVHSMSNALAAATVGLEFGVGTLNIRRSLKEFTPSGKRMEVVKSGSMTILNDTYNANPDSMLSALRTMQRMSARGKRIAVLADMKELGSRSTGEHKRVGLAIDRSVCDILLTFGEFARSIHRSASVVHKRHFDAKSDLIDELRNVAGSGDLILVKGSRGMKMEEVVDSLRSMADDKATAQHTNRSRG